MSELSEQRLSESAKRLHALAHPLRWKLLDLVSSEGEATVSRCSEVLGESVASCSYHLGVLGKYGYLEQLRDRPGRERPWRTVGDGQSLGPLGPELEDQLASEAAVDAFLTHEFERLRSRHTPRSKEPPEWSAAVNLAGSTLWLTAEELQEIVRTFRAAVDRYDSRSSDPELRPEGAREARVFFSTSVRPRP